MTVFAIGAAVRPPTPCWFSRKTEIATRGASAGAKAMNEVVFTPGAPVSAVPVLPATATPGIWAAVPVPLVTTDCIIVEKPKEADEGGHDHHHGHGGMGGMDDMM